MGQRTRKFIGVAGCVGFLIVYCLVAMALGGQYFTYVHGGLQAAYFVAAGLLWLPVVMIIIRWMQKPPAHGDRDP